MRRIFFILYTKPIERRIKTEEKAMVLAAVWGTELIQFLAALAILKKGMNLSYFSYCPAWWKSSYSTYVPSWCNSSYSSNRPGAK